MLPAHDDERRYPEEGSPPKDCGRGASLINSEVGRGDVLDLLISVSTYLSEFNDSE